MLVTTISERLPVDLSEYNDTGVINRDDCNIDRDRRFLLSS